MRVYREETIQKWINNLPITPWSREDTEKLRALYLDSDTVMSEIKQCFPDRSENAIYLKANRLGIQRPILELTIREGV